VCAVHACRRQTASESPTTSTTRTRTCLPAPDTPNIPQRLLLYFISPSQSQGDGPAHASTSAMCACSVWAILSPARRRAGPGSRGGATAEGEARHVMRGPCIGGRVSESAARAGRAVRGRARRRERAQARCGRRASRCGRPRPGVHPGAILSGTRPAARGRVT
jgi:hypothetical protein